jgi:hypothetical protein
MNTLGNAILKALTELTNRVDTLQTTVNELKSETSGDTFLAQPLPDKLYPSIQRTPKATGYKRVEVEARYLRAEENLAPETVYQYRRVLERLMLCPELIELLVSAKNNKTRNTQLLSAIREHGYDDKSQLPATKSTLAKAYPVMRRYGLVTVDDKGVYTLAQEQN